MKENYLEIRMIKRIIPEHIQELLNYKAQDCSTETLEQYK